MQCSAVQGITLQLTICQACVPIVPVNPSTSNRLRSTGHSLQSTGEPPPVKSLQTLVCSLQYTVYWERCQTAIDSLLSTHNPSLLKLKSLIFTVFFSLVRFGLTVTYPLMACLESYSLGKLNFLSWSEGLAGLLFSVCFCSFPRPSKGTGKGVCFLGIAFLVLSLCAMQPALCWC